MTATEYVILVDEQDHEIGHAEKIKAHQQNLLHRAFSVFIFNHEHQPAVLLQQRALSKYHSPGLWTNTCCSHPRPRETIIAAGNRRLYEELGLSLTLTDLGWFKYQADFSNGLSEHEIDHVLIGRMDSTHLIQPNPNEVHAIRWVSLSDLEKELVNNPQQFTPWFKQALQLAKKGL